MHTKKRNYKDLISLGALVALTGFIMSGPVAFVIVNRVNPQPSWVSPAIFAENYSTIQDLPFWFGFLLIGGMLMLVPAITWTTGKVTKKRKFICWLLWDGRSFFVP